MREIINFKTLSINRIHGFQTLSILAVLLVLLNTLAIYFFDLETSRVFRMGSSLLIFIFFVLKKGYVQRILSLAFILFLFRDLFILDYEVITNKTFSFYMSILAYASLTFVSLKKTQILKSKASIILFGVILIGVNIFNVYYLSDIIMGALDNSLQYGLFFVQGAVLLFFGTVAGLYFNRYTGKIPLYYLYFTVCFIFSDIFGLAAYFFDIDFAFYPERILYILALLVMTAFMLEKNQQKKDGKDDNEKKQLF